MKKTIITKYTDLEFRQLIREELQSVLSEVPGMPILQPKPDVLTVDQAAELLKLAKPTLYGLISKNKVPHFKSGKRVLFNRVELEEWMIKRSDI